MNSLDISVSDNIAQLKLGEQTSSTNFYNRSKEFFRENFKIFVELLIPELLAQTNSLIPVDLSQWEIISKKLSGDSLVDLNPEVKVYEASDSSYIFRSENNYICHYKLDQNSEDSTNSSSTFPFVNPSNDPFSGGVLYQMTDDQGNVVESYEIDGATPVYSVEAQSCGFNEVVIQCDTSNLPIHIKKSIPADNSGAFFAEIEYAYKLQEFESACTPQLETKKFFIKDKKIYPLGDRGIYALENNNSNHSILKPNGLFNTTSEILAVDKAASENPWILSSYSIDESNILKIEQLSPPNIELEVLPGSMAFDGTYLFLKPSETTQAPTFYKSNINEDGFTIIRPDVVENGDFYANAGSYKYGELNNAGAAAGDEYANCAVNDESWNCGIWHLGVNWYKRGYAADSDKAFTNGSNGTLGYVFDKEENLIIFSKGWAHSYDKSTDSISRLIADFPPTGLKATAKVQTHDLAIYGGKIDHIATDCPVSYSDSLSPDLKVEGTTAIESCMSWPNVNPQNNFSNNVAAIIGRWENFIVFDDLGAWDPSSLIFTGKISDLPYRPSNRDEPNLGAGNFFDYADGYIFFVNQDKNIYTRYDLRTHDFIQINLDTFGYIADSYEMTRDQVYVQVVNSANSNVEFVKLNFQDGTQEFLGTISQGQRTVIDISPINF